MRYLLGSLLSFMISFPVFAQNPGADYLSLGELKLAKEYFTQNLGQSPAESHYYLGEIAMAEGNTNEAKTQYDKGLAADPESALNAIGVAKLQLKTNTKAAEDQLKDIQKKNKKDVQIILAIAKAYLDNGMKEKAMEKIQDARKADKKSPYIYIFEGDMLAADNKPGDAAMQYDQAINFDSNCTLAYIKGAKVYEFINRPTAIDMMNKAIAIRPDYTIAYKYLAEINYRDGIYSEAVPAYKKFIEGGNYTTEDITRYAASQYFSKNVEEAKNIIIDGLKKDPNSFVLNRLLMYTYNDLKDYQPGVAVGEKFFSIPIDPTDTVRKYLVQDYTAYGKILSETGNKQGAIAQFKKAVELKPDDAALYKSIASDMANEDLYVDAAEFLKKYIELSGEAAEAMDYYSLGQYYWYAGGNALVDTVSMSAAEARAAAVEIFKKADEAFAVVTERVPDSYLGYYWRARANTQLDPQTEEGLAKPYYEEAAKAIEAKGDGSNKRQLVEAYSYLAYYYYLQFEKNKKPEDKANLKSYAEKLLETSPDNPTAISLLEYVNGN